jgi:hypothetical protein
MNYPLQSIDAVRSLAERLSRVPRIAGLSESDHNEPWTLAHSLSDIAGASQAYLQALPSLLEPNLEGDDLMQGLIGLTSELKHMLYHLEDPRFLREMFGPLRDEWAKERSGS